MKKLLLLLVLFVSVTVSCAQGEAEAAGTEKYNPSWEMTDKAELAKMDFGIPLTGFSDTGLLFSQFSQRPLLIFYFSPTCPHCKETYPKIQAVVDEFAGMGLSAIAVSVGHAKKNDVRVFINQQNVAIPMMQDASQDFSKKYGSGHVPMTVLVNPLGEFIRYTENGPAAIDALKADLREMFGM